MNNTSSGNSLLTGGVVPRLLHFLGLRGTALDRVGAASIVIVPLIAWLPLLGLTAANGSLVNRSIGTPFLLDLGVHIRLLVVLPLLFIAARVADRRIGPTIRQFVTRRLVPEEAIPKFEDAIDSAFRLGDSVLADVIILVLIYSADSAIVWRTYSAVDTSTWYSTLTPAALWYAYVSLPLFQFILLRWYYRLFIWARFLVQVAKLNLRLIPTNPDRLGGLGFLLSAMQSLSVFAMAHGALLAGWLASRVLIRRVPLPAFKEEIIVVVVFVLCITIAPLFAFMRSLILAKRRGILEYGALASRYAYDFDVKWVRSESSRDEELIGSADIQSLADMGGSYELVRDMRSLPITVEILVVFIVAVLVPVAPLLLTVMPLQEILKKLAGILF